MSVNPQTKVVKDAIRRYYHLPVKTIARHVLYQYGDLFRTGRSNEEDLELIRTKIRYYMGKHGDKSRSEAADKSLFRDEPVKFPETWAKKNIPYHLEPGLWLILSDAHVPFHDMQAIRRAMEYGKAEHVTGIFLNGDWQDASSIGFWHTYKRNFHHEIDVVIDSLDNLRQQFPNIPIVYKPGNHEYRLPRLFLEYAPQLVESPLAAMETIIGFEQREIEFLDYYQLVFAGDLPILHGHEIRGTSRAVNPARGLFLKAKTFAACSHFHTTSSHTTRDLLGNLITTWSFGCLCNLTPDYNPYCNDWNHGFGVIDVRKDGDFEVDNKRILPNGKIR
jgi:hypothetical protein